MNIMKTWNLDMQGGQAYRYLSSSCRGKSLGVLLKVYERAVFDLSVLCRPGFCLPKIVSSYSGVWLASSLINTFVVPSVLVIKSTPQCRGAIMWVQSKLKMSSGEEDLEAEVAAAVESMQDRVVSLLTTFTTSIAFTPWVPWVGILALLQCPLNLFCDSLCHALIEQPAWRPLGTDLTEERHKQFEHALKFCKRLSGDLNLLFYRECLCPLSLMYVLQSLF